METTTTNIAASIDALLDWIEEHGNPKSRDRNLERTTNAGQDACEVCGRPLKGATVRLIDSVVGSAASIGPECVRKLRRTGFL